MLLHTLTTSTTCTRVDFIVTVRDSRFSPLTNYPQLFRYVSQTAIRCCCAVHSVARAELCLLLDLFRAVAGGCGSACCAHISLNGYLHLLVYIGILRWSTIVGTAIKWRSKQTCRMLSRCRWEHNVIGRRTWKKDLLCVWIERCFRGRYKDLLPLSPIVVTAIAWRSKYIMLVVVILELGRYGWPDSTPQRHDDDESSCVVDEKDFLQFRRARAKIFFSFRAQASGSMRLYQDTHLSNMSESKFRSKMQQAKHAWTF